MVPGVVFRMIARRLLLWTVFCAVSAAPSFILAKDEFNRAAMALGVCLFIAAYTVGTSTTGFQRFHRRPFVRRTLYIGYGARLILSMVMPMGLRNRSDPGSLITLLPDVWPGMLSVQFVESTNLDAESFAGTLATTIVQGALLNVIIFTFMLVVYGVKRLLLKLPADHVPRGFDVVIAPVAATRFSEVQR